MGVELGPEAAGAELAKSSEDVGLADVSSDLWAACVAMTVSEPGRRLVTAQTGGSQSGNVAHRPGLGPATGPATRAIGHIH